MLIEWYELDRHLVNIICVNPVGTDRDLEALQLSLNAGVIQQGVQAILNRLNDSEDEEYLYAIDE